MSVQLTDRSCPRVAVIRSSTSARDNTGRRLTIFAGLVAGIMPADTADSTALRAWRRLIFNFHRKAGEGNTEKFSEVDRSCRNRHHALVDLDKRRYDLLYRLWRQDRKQPFADGIDSRRSPLGSHAILRRSSMALALMNKRYRESPGSRDTFLSLVFLIALRMRRTASS